MAATVQLQGLLLSKGRGWPGQHSANIRSGSDFSNHEREHTSAISMSAGYRSRIARCLIVQRLTEASGPTKLAQVYQYYK